MTNGCFDLLHPGHVASLQEARKQGDCLLVAVNSDRSVRELKGPGRPIIDQQGRAEMLAALACVDYVVIFDEASVAGLVERVLPDVLVKADQYTTEQVVGHEIVTRNGGQRRRGADEAALLDQPADREGPQPAGAEAERGIERALFAPISYQPYAGKPPVRFGGRGAATQCGLPTPIGFP